ncbi:hypothetical protein DSO57_1009533 [Entomophthora muscae]|uniref:Uncharacterized protein n=1 Tax=Entomophthora muscae TaxID=34485 RepID=A0ACC2RLJ9_9FUNG|nr:hypothetical protein DSO57_1009533 [Entomophthora muscae]
MNSSSKVNEWEQKLVGKKIVDGDVHEESETFPREQLPINHRIIPAGGMATLDFNPDRLTITLDKEDKVCKVKMG